MYCNGENVLVKVVQNCIILNTNLNFIAPTSATTPFQINAFL